MAARRGQVESRYVDVNGSTVVFQEVGTGPRTLVLNPGSFNNVDIWWDDPTTARFLQRLAAFSKLILFDRRGTGASDPLPDEHSPSWQAWVEDLNAVLKATGTDSFSMVAQLDGCHMALLFAGLHAVRIESLVLFNASARLRVAPDYAVGLPDETVDSRLDWVCANWGTEEFSLRNYPGRTDDPEFLRWYARYQRSCIPRGRIRNYMSAWWDSDARHVLQHVKVPTLVVHRRDYHFVPMAQGCWLADRLPDARFVDLPGGGSIIGEGVDENADHIEHFVTGSPNRALRDREELAILFTDIVGSTGNVVRAGDSRWHQVLDVHDGVSRRAVRTHDGRLIKTTGDGILATFRSAGDALSCARLIAAEVSDLSLQLRAAIHTGEVELRDEDIGGLNVHVAARLLSTAGANEVSLTRAAARAIAEESELLGVTELKGVPGTWEVRRLHLAVSRTGDDKRG